MFSSAMNYLAGAASSVASGAYPSSSSQTESSSTTPDDPLVGSVVEVGDIRVFIRRRIGEGGFAFVYHAEDMSDRSKNYALKRLLAMDPEKRDQIIQEISIQKGLSSHENIVKFVTAATVDSTKRAASKCDEFLVLMEFCPYNLADLCAKRSLPYPPATVAKIFCQVVHAVSALHNSKPPIIHRDLKLENLLVESLLKDLRLCDFGSATTKTYHPSSDWSMGQRNSLEEEMARHTTPMYRAPEMLDLWSNYPIDTAADIWALGCILYFLCFNQHPFEDSAKLAIINGNYRMPPNDFSYLIFHDLIKQMLLVDPSCRPSCSQILEHLSSLSLENSIDLTTDIDFEITNTDSPITETMPPQDSSLHQSTLPPQAPGVGLISSLRGSAGSFVTRIKDTTKSVLQSVNIGGRGLDLHCITERLAVMSYPSDGFESAYRHHIDDVCAAVENCHAGHYAIINLSERRYTHTKFHSGVVIDAGWKTSGPTSLSTVFETAEKCLKFLQKDPQNVVIVHCLDGRANSAILVSIILMLCKFVTTNKEGLKFFELKRCVPVLENFHKTILHYAEKAVAQRHILLRGVSLVSLVLEPVPLFTKQNDGCRPFVQITNGDEYITAPSSDFAALQQYTTYDEDAVLKLNTKVSGDVILSVFHARQSFGGLFSKMDGVPMFKMYFHSGFIPFTTSCVKFKCRELDGVTSPERFGPEFRAVVNFRLEKDAPHFRINSEWELSLLFPSKSDYEFNRSIMFGKSPSPVRSSPSPPVAPPRMHKATHPPPVPPKPDISRTPSPTEPVGDLLVQPDPVSNIKQTLSSTGPPTDALLLDLGFNGNSFPPQEAKISSHSSTQSFDVLLDFGGNGESSEPRYKTTSPTTLLGDSVKIPPVNLGSSRNSPSVDLFGISTNSSQTSPTIDLFGNTPAASSPTNLFGQTVKVGPKQNRNSFGDLFGDLPTHPSTSKPVLAPVNAFQKPKSVGDELLSNLLGDLEMNSKPSNSSASTGSRKPNYNSAFFQTTQPSKPKGKLSEDTFNDLLSGFSASNGNVGGSKTIGELKRKEIIKHMDPNEAKVFQWKDGKSRNLRALLCSLDTILWKDSRWTTCGMHQLVTSVDVKKMYKKACLAVHPDKQSGTPNEDLAKLIFMELNDAWSEFEKQQEQIGI